mgnify:CR=1 FL=1|jgi:hypothetical protein
MATIKCGLGQVYSTLASAFAALANGDTLETYGPFSEDNKTLTTPATNNITWRHYGGDYTLNGNGITAAAPLTFSGGTGWDVDCRDQNGSDGKLKITSYVGTRGVVFGAANNTIRGIRITDHGAAGVASYLFYGTSVSNLTVSHIAIDAAVDPETQHWYGMWLGACTYNISQVTVENLNHAVTNQRHYIVAFSGGSGSVTDLNITGVVAHRIYGLYLSTTSATINRLKMDDWTCSERYWGVYGWNSTTCTLNNFLLFGCDGAGSNKGFEVDGALTQDINVNNCTLVGDGGATTLAFGVFGGGGLPGTKELTVRNSIVTGTVPGGTGYYATNAASVNSDFNVGNDNATDYSLNWDQGVNDWSSVDPIYADAATDNYRLTKNSPCVDTGIWIPGRKTDLDHQPMSGIGMDRGAYEFQQANTRDVRQEVEGTVSLPSRDERNLRR